MLTENPINQGIVSLQQMLLNSNSVEIKQMKEGSVLVIAGKAKERFVLNTNMLTGISVAWDKLKHISSVVTSHWLTETLETPEDFLNCMVPSDIYSLPYFIDELIYSVEHDPLDVEKGPSVQLVISGLDFRLQFRRLPSVVGMETPYIYFSQLSTSDGDPIINTNILPVVRYLFQSGRTCRVCAVQGGKYFTGDNLPLLDFDYDSIRKSFANIVSNHKGADISKLISDPSRGSDFDLSKFEKDSLEMYLKVKKSHDDEVLRESITSYISQKIKGSNRFDRGIPPLHLASAASFITVAHNQGKRDFDFALDLFLQPHTSEVESGDPIDRHIEQLFKIARELAFQIPGSLLEENGGCVRLILPEKFTFSNSFLEELRTELTK